jgi:oxygen-dependent protoporphyrinogen oxidase
LKVAVLGGGAAGLAAGVTLRRAGIEAVVFEASRSAGGKIQTVVRDGFLFEDGPNSLTAQSVLCASYAHELGLELQPVRPPPTRFVVRRGRPRRAPGFGLVSPLAAARALLEPLFALGKRPAVSEDETLQAFLTRHFGSETGSLLANVLANGIYAGDPERLAAEEAFPRFTALARTGALGSVILGGLSRAFGARRAAKGQSAAPRSLWTLAAGLQSLPNALTGELGSALRLGTRVVALEPEGQAWRVAVSGGDERFDAVICTLPSHVAAELLAEVCPAAALALRQIRYAPIAVVHLGVALTAMPVEPRGFGLLDGEGRLNLLGTLFPSSLFPGRAPAGHALLTSMVGGVRHAELLRFDDARLVALVRDDLGRLLGLRGAPAIQRVHRWEAAVPQYELGHGRRVQAAVQAVAKLPLFQLAGAAYHGVSLELTLQSGAAAARRIAGGSPPFDTAAQPR